MIKIRHAVQLLPGERIDELERNGYGIIQKEKAFRFGMDAVLLSGFASVRAGELAMDLGTGTGIIPILLEAKTDGAQFFGIEIQKEMAEMARRSAALNGLCEKVHILEGDIRALAAGTLANSGSEGEKAENAEEAAQLAGLLSGGFSVVTSNPPYMKAEHGLQNPELGKAVARHEVLCTFADVCAAAARLLRSGGRFYLVHRPRRLPELLAELSAARLSPKRLKLVHPSLEKEANMVLIEAVKDGKSGSRVEKPLIVFDANGAYMPEIREVYGY